MNMPATVPPAEHNDHKVSACWSMGRTIEANTVAQILVGASTVKVEEIDGRLWAGCSQGKWLLVNPDEEYSASTLAIRLRSRATSLMQVDTDGAKWIGGKSMVAPALVRDDLDGKFGFVQENPAKNRKGLRDPQVGAIHAVLGYWTLKQNLPATVVMPTGTGKTETMLSLFAAAQPKLLLVLVPSDALREQLAKKFETYGVLKEFKVLEGSALHPAVGRLGHGFKTAQAAKDFTDTCNVIIATPNALNYSAPEARAVLLAECSHLFVDEAHHIAAPTWRSIRDEFTGKPVVQFTATPFREDGADLGGKLAYVFPLRAAQEQGYFSKINYAAVVDFDNLDEAIAAKAIELLKTDLERGLGHILMARVRRIGRAKDILEIYQRLAPELNPVILHSELKPKSAQASALAAVKAGNSRVVICVDMLGEGFDLPSLKVAAIHDPHKSLGITLQFIGRFARVAGDSIGEASVVVGRMEADFDENLKKLYAEDADWNLVVNNLSAAAVGEQEELGEFEEGFQSLPEELSLRNISPKMSTVVYRTYCENWRPDELEKFFEARLFTNPVAINPVEHVAWLVTKEAVAVKWGDVKTVEEVAYDLYALHWDVDTKLLYINSSNNDGLHEDLAKAVCGDTAERIRGRAVYRAMANIKRRVPTNVGLLDARDKRRSFAMHSGANVTEAFPTADAQTKTQTNIFGYGFEAGDRVSRGISLKGRIWSHAAAPTLKHWVDWSRHIGASLIDESINVDDVIAEFIQPVDIETRPELVALAFDWPWEILTRLSDDLRVEHGGSAGLLIDVDLKITSFSKVGAIPFQVITPEWTLDYTLEIGNSKLTFRPVGADANVVTSRKNIPLSSFLDSIGLKVLMEGEALITPQAVLIQPRRELHPFNIEHLTSLDWAGIDLHKESQGRNRDADSIQARMIREVSGQATWDLILDDDGKGEMADIVAVRMNGNTMVVSLIHCKYSTEPPGSRVGDLYEVCGQAQKSVEWRRKPDLFFRHLIRRERTRRKNGYSGLIVGDAKKLLELAERAQFSTLEFHVSIAQPGLSKDRVSLPVLNLLACTEVYIQDTSVGTFSVYVHP